MKKKSKVEASRPRTPEMYRVMAAIQKYHDETGFTPLYREIAAETGMSIPSAWRRAVDLAADGWLALKVGAFRQISILRRLESTDRQIGKTPNICSRSQKRKIAIRKTQQAGEIERFYARSR